MERKKIILWATLGGALIGALAVRFTGVIPPAIRDFGIAGSLGRAQFLLAIIPWLIFSFYWEIAAKNAAADKSSESQSSRAVHVFLTNAAILLEIVQFRSVPRFLPRSAVILAAGVVISSAGLILCIWARRCLGRNWSGKITIKVDHQLIRSGPYKLLRHPIYTGILAMYVGTAVVSGSWLALLGLAMAFFAYARKLRMEEANLRIAFPADYEGYVRETWALFPGLY
ncbi:MAG: isoprenylcysteine carboxylmethyltransferase family protein [Terracidiphilus sp.]